MNKLKSENYIVIPAWATQEPYNLKHNELIIFSIIYGFCQHKDQCFCGSISYLAEWTGSSRQGVSKNLNNLIRKGLIRKEECWPTNRYYIVNKKPVYEEIVDDSLNKIESESKESLDNNITNNTNNNIDKYKAEKDISSSIEEIIKYLNQVCGSSFKAITAITKKLIKARFREGFTIDDFKKVIDFKYKQWGENPVKFNNGRMSNDYLRPTTLFGDNFDTYLNEANNIKTGFTVSKFTSQSTLPSEERSDLNF